MSTSDFPSKETIIMLNGPIGVLEALLVGPESNSIKAIGIICHPHPLYGGTMHNKVVTTLAKVFKDLGLGVVRFNFRGVGKSEGHYDNGQGEMDDLLAVMDWVKQTCPNRPIWLAGFSFGSFVAAKVANQHPVEKLVLVAPPIKNFSFADVTQIKNPWWVVQGGQDELVSAPDVLAWAKSLPHPPQLIYLPDASHFFHGCLGQLRSELEQALTG